MSALDPRMVADSDKDSSDGRACSGPAPSMAGNRGSDDQAPGVGARTPEPDSLVARLRELRAANDDGNPDAQANARSRDVLALVEVAEAAQRVMTSAHPGFDEAMDDLYTAVENLAGLGITAEETT